MYRRVEVAVWAVMVYWVGCGTVVHSGFRGLCQNQSIVDPELDN